MNSPEALIAEKFLMHASPEKVYDWLERHEQDAFGESLLLHLPGEKVSSVYERLASRSEPLVKLGLARFCPDGDVVRVLFLTGDEAIRCSALSNRPLMACTGLLAYFLGDATLRELLLSGTEAEIQALTMNPEFPTSPMASSIIRREHFAEGMISEDRWYELIANLSRNPKLEKAADVVPPDHGSVETVLRSFSSVSDLWGLLLVAPVNNKWADLLISTCDKLPYRRPRNLYTDALDALCGGPSPEMVVGGEKRVFRGWNLDTSITEIGHTKFAQQLRTEDKKFLERVFARWTKGQEGEAPELRALVDVGLRKAGLTESEIEEQRIEEAIEADPYAGLRRTIANKVATAALVGNLDFKSQRASRVKEKRSAAAEDARLTFLEQHPDPAVRSGYERAALSAEISQALKEPTKYRLRHAIAQIYLMVFVVVVLSGISAIAMLAFAIRPAVSDASGWTRLGAVVLLVAGLLGLFKLGKTLDKLGGIPAELR